MAKYLILDGIKYRVSSTANPPYLKVDNNYLPLTTNTVTTGQAHVVEGNKGKYKVMKYTATSFVDGVTSSLDPGVMAKTTALTTTKGGTVYTSSTNSNNMSNVTELTTSSTTTRYTSSANAGNMSNVTALVKSGTATCYASAEAVGNLSNTTALTRPSLYVVNGVTNTVGLSDTTTAGRSTQNGNSYTTANPPSNFSVTKSAAAYYSGSTSSRLDLQLYTADTKNGKTTKGNVTAGVVKYGSSSSAGRISKTTTGQGNAYIGTVSQTYIQKHSSKTSYYSTQITAEVPAKYSGYTTKTVATKWNGVSSSSKTTGYSGVSNNSTTYQTTGYTGVSNNSTTYITSGYTGIGNEGIATITTAYSGIVSTTITYWD